MKEELDISSCLTMQRQHYRVSQVWRGLRDTRRRVTEAAVAALTPPEPEPETLSHTWSHQWGACDEAVMWLVHVRQGECWLAVLTLGTHHLLFWCLTQHFSARTEESTEFSRFPSPQKDLFSKHWHGQFIVAIYLFAQTIFLTKVIIATLLSETSVCMRENTCDFFRDFLISFLFSYLCEWKIENYS